MGQIAERYTYRVRWSEEDGEYLATVAEFPSLSWLEDDLQAAFSGLVSLVSEILIDMEENSETIPEPYSMREFSGNVRLRIPPEQHRELTIQASEEGVSLNRLICSLISRPRRVENACPQTVTANQMTMQVESELHGKSASYPVKHRTEEGSRYLELVEGWKSAASTSITDIKSDSIRFDWEEM